MSTSPSTLTPDLVVGAGWARERLRLGMTNVGFWVVVAVALLFSGAPVLGLGPLDGLALVAAVMLLQAPFDLVGGWWLQQRHDRGPRPFGAFFVAWLRAALIQALLVTAAGTAALALHALGGSLAVLLGAIVGMVWLLGLQGPFIWLMTGLRTRALSPDEAGLAAEAGLSPAQVKVVPAHDPSFVGGWVGLPGTETLVVPDHWRRVLSDAQWTAQLARRQVTRRSGLRLRGVLLALIWNTAGLGVALAVFGAADLDGLVRTIAAYTLWSFLAVLVLPTASRQGVYAADRAAREAGVPVAVLASTLHRLDGLQDDEPERGDLVETIFHPVPALSRRTQALRASSGAEGGAWHAARMSLLLGQVVASPLSRAVHCNIGRPELWAAYPGD